MLRFPSNEEKSPVSLKYSFQPIACLFIFLFSFFTLCVRVFVLVVNWPLLIIGGNYMFATTYGLNYTK